LYGSTKSVSGDEEERVRFVKFSDDVFENSKLDVVV